MAAKGKRHCAHLQQQQKKQQGAGPGAASPPAAGDAAERQRRERSQKRLRALEDWYDRAPPGLIERIQEEADKLAQKVPGQIAVQVGDSGRLSLIQAAPVKQSCLLSLHSRRGQARCSLEALPLAPSSVSLLALAHSCECCEDERRLLKSARTALRPGGHLLVLTLNPPLSWRLRPWMRHPWLPPLLSMLARPSLESRLADSGFRTLHRLNFSQSRAPLWGPSIDGMIGPWSLVLARSHASAQLGLGHRRRQPRRVVAPSFSPR